MQRKFNSIRVARITVITFCICLLVVYVFYQSYGFFKGPTITLSTPYVLFTEKDSVTLSGITSHSNVLRISGKKVFIDQNGFFKEEFFPHLGYNRVVIEGIDRYKRITREHIIIIKKSSSYWTKKQELRKQVPPNQNSILSKESLQEDTK